MSTQPTTTSYQQDFLWPVRKRIQTSIQTAQGELKEAVNYLFASEGKMLRPTLVWLCADAFCSFDPDQPTHRGLDIDAVIDFAAAAEMIHVASLIHDDVIDHSLTRRDMVSLNRRFGNHTAVLVGDYLFASAFELLSRHASHGVVSLMTRAITRMCQGEIQQKLTLFDPMTTEKGYFSRIEGKTAALIAACCEGGARFAGADDFASLPFQRYGLKLGLAFQIVDDILDLDGKPDHLGKPIGQDLRQGVITLPIIRLLAQPHWYQRLAPHLINRHIDEPCLKMARDAAQAAGALASARQTADKMVHEALAEIDPYVVTPAGQMLKQLGSHLTTRIR